MTRQLRVVDPGDPAAVMSALARAITADGPAVIAAASPPLDLPAHVEQRVALVVETSGSTGKPKRVALSAGALLASAAASDSALGGPGQWLLALPTHYIAGINVLVRSLAAQTEPVMLAPGHFEPSEFAAAALRMDAALRFTALVPAQLASLIDAADHDLDLLEPVRRFDRILLGGQAASSDLLAKAVELGLNVTTTYGSSETSGGCVYDGVPIGTTRARLVDGQLELGGPTLAEGYLDDPERTAATFHDEDGARWYRTGDTGSVEDGIVTVTGRLDGLIISGGIKVSLDEVERLVRTLPGLADAVAVRARSERWGEVPVIVTTGEADLAAVRASVSAALGRAAAPAAVLTVDELPTLASGKPDRLTLAKLVQQNDH
ncbi:MAG: O-succinylbenzoate-CoA ligase [Microbacteriaceae bacterium]|nr:O-succinylbenzoate-CoA ligase [Microbacteriaceae bacterium]